MVLAACGAAPNQPNQSNPQTVGGAGRGEILWDTWGIPHIYGERDADVAYGLGRAQMQSHGDLLLTLYGQARGRAAEYWGEEHLPLDRWIHTMSVPTRAEVWLTAAEPGERAVIEGFVAGINSYAAEHPEQVRPELKAVLPIRAADVLAHLQRVVLFTFVSSPLDAMGAVEQWSRAGEHAGSNAWAIAPARSSSGGALLLANPHLPWGGPFTMYEVQLVAPGLDIYGVAFVGFPVVAIGFNRDLAWTHTVNTLDGADLYELELTERGYRLDGGERALEERSLVLRVRQPDGSLRDEPLVVRSSVHGPVIGARGDRALALRVVGLDAPHLIGQYLQMARATGIGELEGALARLQLPMFNVIAADRRGHVLEVFNGRVPRRAEGDAAFWAGVVPGTRSALVWDGVLPYGQLPRVADPPSGWLQNSNDPPWSMTMPGAPDPARFPAYLAPREIASYRTQRSIELIRGKGRMTLDDVIAAKFSTRLPLADRLLDELLPAARRGSARARQAAEVLAAWDRTTDAKSRGGVLFAAWAKKYLGPDTFASAALATKWSAGAPLTTPDGLVDPARAAAVLDEVAGELLAKHGALDVAWGDVHRIRLGGADLPAAGAADALGSFSSTWYSPEGGGVQVADGGDTFVAAVELGPAVRARAALIYGNASAEGSRHRADQLPLFRDQRLRDVWRTRSEIEQHLERRETF